MGDPGNISANINPWQGWATTPAPAGDAQPKETSSAAQQASASGVNFEETPQSGSVAVGKGANLVQLTSTNPDGTTATAIGTLAVTVNAAALGGSANAHLVFTPKDGTTASATTSKTVPAATVQVSNQPYVVATNPMLFLIGVLEASNQLGQNLTMAVTKYIDELQKVQKAVTGMVNYLQNQLAGVDIANTSDSTEIAKITIPTTFNTHDQEILAVAVGPTTYDSLVKDAKGGVVSIPYATCNQVLTDLENLNSNINNTINMASQRMLQPLQTSTTNNAKQMSSLLASGQQVQSSLIQNIS